MKCVAGRTKLSRLFGARKSWCWFPRAGRWETATSAAPPVPWAAQRAVQTAAPAPTPAQPTKVLLHQSCPAAHNTANQGLKAFGHWEHKARDFLEEQIHCATSKRRHWEISVAVLTKAVQLFKYRQKSIPWNPLCTSV